MSAIYGAFDLRGRRGFPRERLAAMGFAIAHRGPDTSGAHHEPGLALGAHRLAVVDLANGGQPVIDARYVAVVNGELFDHASERARLTAAGARFRTACDAEIWVHAFAEEGEDYLSRARGQFALAIWDRRERRLVLARDRFGICPLFATEADGWLLFASESKALFATGLVRPRLDPRAIDHAFTCRSASPLRSAFVEIVPVPPGHRVVARDGTTIAARFVDLAFPARGYERRATTARAIDAVASEIEAALCGAVERRLAADAPVAIHLGADVASALLLALASRTHREVTAFSIEPGAGLGPDDLGLAAQAARRVGVEHVIVPLEAAQIAAVFPTMVAHAEVPLFDHGSAAMLVLAREVRRHGFKALVGSDGAEEGFAGCPWTSLAHRGGAVARAAALGLGVMIGGGGLPGPSVLTAIAGTFAATGAGQLSALIARARAYLYARSFWEELGESTPADDHIWDRGVAAWHPLHRSLYADYECVLAGHRLADRGDRAAMGAGVELRYPFLDEAVVELAASLHPALKIRGGRDQWILREVAHRYLPSSNEPRAPVVLGIQSVIHGPSRPAWVDELLSPPSLRTTGLFDSTKISRVLGDRLDGSRHPRHALLEGALTGVISTQLLAHLFCGSSLCSLPQWTAR